ncbi:MAG: hypothetical protein ACOY5C_02780 [Pseudomonadota bacterium]
MDRTQGERLAVLEREVVDLKSIARDIRDYLGKLTSLETHHAETRNGLERAFGLIEDQETRLRQLELAQARVDLMARGLRWLGGAVGALVLAEVWRVLVGA